MMRLFYKDFIKIDRIGIRFYNYTFVGLNELPRKRICQVFV